MERQFSSMQHVERPLGEDVVTSTRPPATDFDCKLDFGEKDDTQSTDGSVRSEPSCAAPLLPVLGSSGGATGSITTVLAQMGSAILNLHANNNFLGTDSALDKHV